MYYFQYLLLVVCVQVARVFDILFVFGTKALLAASLAILELGEQELLTTDGPSEFQKVRDWAFFGSCVSCCCWYPGSSSSTIEVVVVVVVVVVEPVVAVVVVVVVVVAAAVRVFVLCSTIKWYLVVVVCSPSFSCPGLQGCIAPPDRCGLLHLAVTSVAQKVRIFCFVLVYFFCGNSFFKHICQVG